MICLIGILIHVGECIDLPEQEILACFLFASHLMADDLFQMGDRFGIVLRMDIVVGQRIVPFLAGNTGYRVAAGIADDLLGIVEPSTLYVGLGHKPWARL